jgi:hypothetical protein
VLRRLCSETWGRVVQIEESPRRSKDIVNVVYAIQNKRVCILSLALTRGPRALLNPSFALGKVKEVRVPKPNPRAGPSWGATR